MDSLYVGHQGPWDQGRSADRAELPGRVSGQRRAGGWSQPREAQTCSGGVARGLRAVEGGLACGSGSRSPAPRLPGDPVTSDGGPRRPGMAAWSPAAAAPMLRGTRGVRAGRAGRSPGAGAAEGRRGRPLPARGLRAPRRPRGCPFLSLFHSFTR